jgi:hypothetical protein
MNQHRTTPPAGVHAIHMDPASADAHLPGPLGGMLTRAAMIANRDRSEARAIAALWSAMKDHRVRVLAARGLESLWDEGLLYIAARQFLRWAEAPMCAGCGAPLPSPVECERVQFENTRNRPRFDALLCLHASPLHASRNPCGEKLVEARRSAGLPRVVTWCGPLPDCHRSDFAGFSATVDGLLIPPAVTS